jgi:tripartite-type tricarboxylate transporter receptor subunit TctC
MKKLAALLLVCAVGAAQAQNPADGFPSKPVKIIVPFAPGGATDITARVLGEKLQAKWGQPVVIENRPGAGGNIGAHIVAQSPPDGYTLVLGVTGSHGINISLHKKMPYHPLKDFEPITQATVYPNAIVVHPSFPANNLQELLALARKEPGKYVYGSDGTGTGSHLTMALLNHKAGVKMQHAPYKGSGPIVADVMGQQLPIGVTGIVGVISSYKSGKLKVLAVTGPERSPAAPELPTVAEQGFPGFAGEPWSGFFAPKGTPRPIVDKLADDMIAAMRLPDVTKRMAELGTPLVGSRPDEFRAYVANEIEKWAEAVKVSGATVE